MANQVTSVGEAHLFAGCPSAERRLLASLAVPLRVPAGNDVVGQGDFGSTIGVILEGRASVWVDGERIADIGAGDCFGELAALAPPGTDGHRAASVRAETEVRVDTVSVRDINRELSALPQIAEALRRQAASYDG